MATVSGGDQMKSRCHTNNALKQENSRGNICSHKSQLCKCSHCDRHFKESRSLVRHLRESCKHNQSPRGRYWCDWCDSSFGRNDILHRHVREIHLLQGNKQRMLKMRREAATILYGEPLDHCTVKNTLKDDCKGETSPNVLSCEYEQPTRSHDLPICSGGVGKIVRTEARSHQNAATYHSRHSVKNETGVSEVSSITLLDANISSPNPPAGRVWSIASPVLHNFETSRDDMANRTGQQNATAGFEIEDWINLCFLREHSEYNEA